MFLLYFANICNLADKYILFLDTFLVIAGLDFASPIGSYIYLVRHVIGCLVKEAYSNDQNSFWNFKHMLLPICGPAQKFSSEGLEGVADHFYSSPPLLNRLLLWTCNTMYIYVWLICVFDGGLVSAIIHTQLLFNINEFLYLIFPKNFNPS